jgi:hypothetical protein
LHLLIITPIFVKKKTFNYKCRYYGTSYEKQVYSQGPHRTMDRLDRTMLCSNKSSYQAEYAGKERKTGVKAIRTPEQG